MTNKKKIIFLTIILVVFAVIFYLVEAGSPRPYEFKKIARAVGGMPWQFGGRISLYQPVCVATPPDGICKNCPMCGAVTGPYTCAAYSEIQFTPVSGSQPPTFVCPLQGYLYRGGGTIPRPGGSILGGGSSPAFPWVIGISP